MGVRGIFAIDPKVMSLLFTAVGFWFIAVVHSVWFSQSLLFTASSSCAGLFRTRTGALPHSRSRARGFFSRDHLPGATLPGPLFSMNSPFEIGDFAEFGVSHARLKNLARRLFFSRARAHVRIIYARARVENAPILWDFPNKSPDFRKYFSEIFFRFSGIIFARDFCRAPTHRRRNIFPRPSTRGDPSEAIIFDEFAI